MGYSSRTASTCSGSRSYPAADSSRSRWRTTYHAQVRWQGKRWRCYITLSKGSGY